MWTDFSSLMAGTDVWRSWLDAAQVQLFAFLLVVMRLSGMAVLSPLLGQASLPMNVRVLLILSLSMILTPALGQRAEIGFAALDANSDGVLTPAEVPEEWLPQFSRLAAQAGQAADQPVALADFTRPLPAPASVVDFAVLVGCEFVLGFALGLGVHLVIVGLQLAGQIVDTQSGMNLGEIFNPDFGGSGSQTSQLMFWYATALFLLLEPLGGHLQLISLFVRSFDALPVGSAFLAESTGDLLLTLIQQSMVLGLRVAAPLLVVMSLVDLSLGILGHSVPQINLQALGFALRAFVGFLMLILLFSGIVDLLVVAVVDTFELLSTRLLFSSP